MAVDRDQRDGEDRDHRTGGDDGARPLGADDALEDRRQTGSLAFEFLPRLGGQGGDGDEDVDGGDDEEGGDEGPGHRLLRILRLISCRGDGVHADVAEEDQPGAGNDAGESEGGEVGEVVGVPAGHAHKHEEDEDADLEADHDGVDDDRFAGAAHQQEAAHREQRDRRQVDNAALLGRIGQGVRDLEAEEVEQQLVDVLRPADGHGGSGDTVFEEEAGGDTHGRQLAQGGIGIGVRGSGDRDGTGEFGIADDGEAGDDAGDDERPDHGRAGHGHGFGEDEEDARADGRADADHRQ